MTQRRRIAPVGRRVAAPRGRVLPDPADLDVRPQPQERPDRHVLHVSRTTADILQRPAVLADDQVSLRARRSRRSRSRLAAASCRRLLGAPEGAAAAAGDRLPRARPVRRRRRSSSSSVCSTSTAGRRTGSTASPYGFLVAAYVILAFPYMFFSLDAGFRSIDVHTLTEASQSLGAGWPTTLFRVILPNIKAAALAASFLTLAIVMGEYTIASLSAFNTFPSTSSTSTRTRRIPAAAVTLLASGSRGPRCSPSLVVGAGRRDTCRGRRARHGRRRAPAAAPALRRRRRPRRHRPRDPERRVRLVPRPVAGAARRPRCGSSRASTGPTSGQVVVDGKDITGVPPNKRGHRAWSSRRTASSRT